MPLDDITVARLRRLGRAIIYASHLGTIRDHLNGRVTIRHVESALAGRELPDEIAEYIARKVRSPSFERALERREREHRYHRARRGRAS